MLFQCRRFTGTRLYRGGEHAASVSAGRYADFHATRHTFISNLSRSGARPKVAQSLARHSDINLTMGVYPHAELEDQNAAIAALPAPPRG